MYAKKNADKRLDSKALGFVDYLNFERTDYLAVGKEGKRLFVKVVPLFGDQQFQASQQAVIRKTFTSSLYYFKPQGYDFRDNTLQLCSRVQPLSLQSVLWIHQREQKPLSTSVMRDFTVRTFEGIARMKPTDIFPQNLKPSNIFMELRGQERNWVWGQAGLHTIHRSQYHSKLNLQNLNKNASVKIDPFQLEFYSLAVMLAEAATLQPPSVVDKQLRSSGRLEGLPNFDQAEDYYGVRFTRIIRLLLQPPKDGSLNKAVQQYKQSQDQQEGESPHYEDYQFTEDRLEGFLKDKLMRRIEEAAKDYIKDKKFCARDIFEKMGELDPQFSFSFGGLRELSDFMDYLGVRLEKSELLFVGTYYTYLSLIRYFRFVQLLFPAKELIECIIVKAADNYDTFKEFFESQTAGKDFWKLEEIRQFLESLEAPFEEKDVLETLKTWTKGNSKTSIKYAELYAVFKPIIGMSMSLSVLKKPAGEVGDGAQLLITMMQRLKRKLQEDKGQDLITFFRKNDVKENWTVDNRIYKTIKNYTKDREFDEEKYRKAFIEMEKEGSVGGDMTGLINYIFLIRNLELEEPLTLLRQVITQKINESNRDSFFSRYEKNEKGWTFQSLQEFNHDENLQFDDRELRALFNEMDSDHSGTVETRELFYKLTNIKEFDYQFILDSIQEKITKEGFYLFEAFEEADPRARLVLGNPAELRGILESLGVELSEDHLQQFYNKFSRKGRFEYLAFLREFHPKEKLFLSAVRCILTQHYKGSFDRLYTMGLREGKKKWNVQSLEMINEEMVLGFRQEELKEIWSCFDPNAQGSLTKEEVSQIFNYQFVKTSELTTKALQSIRDLPRKQDEQPKKETGTKKQVAQDPKDQDIMSSFRQLGEKQLIAMCLKMINTNPDNNGRLFLQDCIMILQDGGIPQNKKEITKLLNSFKEQGRKISVNFIQFFFYIYDQVFSQNQQSIPRLKGNLTLQIIKEVKKTREISNADMFHWCKKKDKMRLSDFEEVFRKLVEVDVYYQDIESVWQSWGQQDYFTQEDIDQLLQTKEYKPKTEKEKEKEREKDKFGREKSGRERERQKSGRDKEPTPKLQKKDSKRPNLKLSQENRMIDFVNEEEGETPYLKRPLSFGEKDPTFRKENSKNSNSIRESGNADMQDTPINKFKAENSQRDRQVRGAEKKKSAFPGKKVKEQKQQLQEYVNPTKQSYKKDEKKISYSKNQLLEKLREDVAENGEQYISELFSKANIIDSKRFVSCLSIHYRFSQDEAIQLADYLAKFDKIKLDTIKDHLKGTTQKEEKPKSKEKAERRLSPQKSATPVKRDKEGKKLVDPRRQKVNIPLVREHIKVLKGEFCKRFQINELEPFFFGERDSIAREDFITKCQSISTTFSSNVCEKVFDYLKPDSQDKVNVLSFKLGMGLDEPVDEQEEDYLPQELQKQLKIVFDKADKDHSGFIEPTEVQELLSSLGFNENIKEIENYFAKMDQNFDNRISYNEFRHFIEDQILPQISNFDEDEEELEETLRNNDIFRSGSLAATTFQAVIERYGVKLSQIQVQILVRALSSEGTQIRINQLLSAVREPTLFEGKVKGVLYKIRLRKKVQLRQIQKVFQNISSCFVLAYTPAVMEKEILNISSPYRPVLHECGLFYCDIPLRDARKTGQSEEGIVGGELLSSDILVEIALKQVNGVPIPQRNEVKGNIVRRYLNISFFDLSAEMLKHSIWQVEAEFDPQVEDVWRFSNSVRSVFIKVAGYEPRKFEKIVLLFQLIIAVVEGTRTLQINCGCCTLPLRQLLVPEGKVAKKLKLIAGLPNRSKEIDKNSISKRSGWKNFFGGEIQSELEIQLIHQNKFKEYHRMLAALPPQVLLGRKALHYLWIYREVMAENAFDGNNVNPFLSSDLRMLAFRLSLDVPEVFSKICLWWKEKVESKVKSLSDAKKVFKILMQQLYLILHAKQFQLVKRSPSKAYLHNKSLTAARTKMIADALDNVDGWLSTGPNNNFKRKKAYNFNYGPLQLHELDLPKQHRAFMQHIAKLVVK